MTAAIIITMGKYKYAQIPKLRGIRILILFLFVLVLPQFSVMAYDLTKNITANDILGDGSQANPYNVAAVRAFNPTSTSEAPAGGAGVWVKGYIVGYMPPIPKTTLDNTVFSAPADLKTNIVLGPTFNCKDYNQCISIQLPAGAVRTALNLQDNPNNLGAAVLLYGDVMKYCGSPGLKNLSKYEIITEGEGNTPPTSEDIIYEGLINSSNDWRFDNITLPEAATNIWSWREYNGSGYLNASGHIGGNACASEAIAYTTIDLSDRSDASLTFDHAAKFQTTLKQLCGMVVREAGTSTWYSFDIPRWPDAGSWTFVSSGSVSLKAYAGRKIEIGFKYGSNASGADTWEIKNFIVKGTNITEATEVNGLFYRQVSQSEVWIAYNGDVPYSGDIIIPEKVSIAGATYIVSGIEKYAFENCRTLTSISIPNSVVSIGTGAFYGCTSLTSISIPSSVTTLGTKAFQDCTDLTDVTFVDNDADLKCGSDLFSGCNITNLHMGRNFSGNTVQFYGMTNLKNVTFGKINTINKNSFSGCSGLSSINIPASVTSIGASAFSNCSNLTNVTIADSNTDLSFGDYDTFDNCKIVNLYIGRNFSGSMSQFYWMTTLKKVSFGNNVTVIGDDFFGYCMNLISVKLPSSLISIGNNAFYYCKGLTSIELPATITSIGDGAFANSSLVSINIPAAVTNIGGSAFKGSRLRTILVNTKVPTALTAQPFFIDEYSTLYVPEGRNRVYARAEYWKDFPNIQEYSPEKEIAYIDRDLYYAPYTQDKAFVQASSNLPTGDILPLREITLNGKTYAVDAIPSGAFEDCANITSVTIPENISTIGFDAFENCNKLTDVTIADSKDVLIMTANSYKIYSQFTGCPIENLHYGRNISGTGIFVGKDKIVNLTFGEMVTEIAESAFMGCSSLIGVSLPNNVTSIGAGAFYGCENLKAIDFSQSVTQIGDYAFSNCTSLPVVYIPVKVAKIGSGAFYNNTALRSIYSPTSTPASLGDNVFNGVDKYNCVLYVPAGAYEIYLKADQWKDFIDTQEVQFWDDGELSFMGKNGRNATATVIACKSTATDIILKEKVTPAITVQREATTEYTVNSIAPGAFSNCNMLVRLKINCNNVLECEGEPFNEYLYKNCELVVPDTLYNDYSIAEYWKNFNIIKMESAGIGDIKVDNDFDTITVRKDGISANTDCNVIIFTVDGREIANCHLVSNEKLNLIPGIYIVSINGNQIKIAIR